MTFETAVIILLILNAVILLVKPTGASTGNGFTKGYSSGFKDGIKYVFGEMKAMSDAENSSSKVKQ